MVPSQSPVGVLTSFTSYEFRLLSNCHTIMYAIACWRARSARDLLVKESMSIVWSAKVIPSRMTGRQHGIGDILRTFTCS